MLTVIMAGGTRFDGVPEHRIKDAVLREDPHAETRIGAPHFAGLLS